MSTRDVAKIPKRINSIKFSLMDPNEIRKMSSVEVKTADTYRDDGHAFKQGLMDPKMGVIDPGVRCETCGNKHEECPSHFGHIALELPVMHIGFTDLIKMSLKSTCNSCSQILLHSQVNSHPLDPEKSEQDYYRDRVKDVMVKHGVGSREFKKIIKDIEKECSSKKRTICMHCGSEQGKIILDKPSTFKEKKENKGEHKLNARDIREWLERIPDQHLIFIGMDYHSSRPEWTIMKVLPVPPITVRPSITLDSGDRSEDDLTHKLVDVLRINQRLRENRDAGAPQLIVEDLWELLQYHCTTYFDNQTAGIPPARHRSGRPLKTLTQRLKGKEGRFRSNLSGKRVNFCARTVISPDPNLGINEVGIPVQTAKELTVPIRITSRNREQLRQMILRGPDVHPGVNYIIRGDRLRVRITDRTKYIWAGFRCLNPDCHTDSDDEPYNGYRPDLDQVLHAPNFLPGLELKRQMKRNSFGELEEEWGVDLEKTLTNLRGEDERGQTMAENDERALIFNRWKWEHSNPDEFFPEHLEISCPHCGSPAVEDDFGESYRTEVEDRLSTFDRDGNPRPGVVVERHLIDGDVTIFNRQPSLHRMSMMVHEIRVMPGKTFRFNLADCTPYNADFDGDEMNLHVIQSEEARSEAKILMRVQEHIITPRYGGSVIGGIHDHISGAYLLTHGERFLSKTLVMEVLGEIGWDGELPETIERDGITGYLGSDILSLIVPTEFNLDYTSRSGDNVIVNQGKVTGTIDKRGIGAEDGRLLDAVVQTHGSDVGAEFINRMTKMTIAICTSMGFTTGIDDEDLPPEAKAEIDAINKRASDAVDEELLKFGKDGRHYEVRPGRTPMETLEENILTILDSGKGESGNVAKEFLGDDNSAVLMATSGARGSMDNLAMMAGSIGQPKVRGKRLERGYQGRVLTHFQRGVKGAQEKGFVSSSFKRGLEPTEFFMLSVSGRESLVDTAVRTSKSGYMQRRLINAMDDLKVANDGMRSVRNTADRIIQFEYGEDRIDPARSRKGEPFDINQVLDDALGGRN
ncbi:MAG: DNA-directed RNA polymerase subunit A' [Euryarchaeota archaeon]|jgi:DNA-directed RNA polymerase beta' subunit|nr:DNA-directed RNA polymerase subunit A' [Euryarchaeota archaeon]